MVIVSRKLNRLPKQDCCLASHKIVCCKLGLSWRLQNSSTILSASMQLPCVGLWHEIACQRKLGYVMKLKHSSEPYRLIFCWICKWVYCCNSIWSIIVKQPRMLSAQFVALYKPCKPKPKPCQGSWKLIRSSVHYWICISVVMSSSNSFSIALRTVDIPLKLIFESKISWSFFTSNLFWICAITLKLYIAVILPCTVQNFETI